MTRITAAVKLRQPHLLYSGLFAGMLLGYATELFIEAVSA
jgi:hypothetical protein